MRLVILGATGGTGRALLQQALDTGHQVTAIVRRPTAISLTHQRLLPLMRWRDHIRFFERGACWLP